MKRHLPPFFLSSGCKADLMAGPEAAILDREVEALFCQSNEMERAWVPDDYGAAKWALDQLQ